MRSHSATIQFFADDKFVVEGLSMQNENGEPTVLVSIRESLPLGNSVVLSARDEDTKRALVRILRDAYLAACHQVGGAGIHEALAILDEVAFYHEAGERLPSSVTERMYAVLVPSGDAIADRCICGHVHGAHSLSGTCARDDCHCGEDGWPSYEPARNFSPERPYTGPYFKRVAS